MAHARIPSPALQWRGRTGRLRSLGLGLAIAHGRVAQLLRRLLHEQAHNHRHRQRDAARRKHAVPVAAKTKVVVSQISVP